MSIFLCNDCGAKFVKLVGAKGYSRIGQECPNCKSHRTEYERPGLEVEVEEKPPQSGGNCES